jgi:hypothetical protein
MEGGRDFTEVFVPLGAASLARPNSGISESSFPDLHSNVKSAGSVNPSE